jgi:rhamnogalacturonyl hydrolase YesR
MDSRGRKNLVIFLLLAGFVSTAAASDLVYNVTGEQVNNTPNNFVFENQSSVTSPQLYIEDPEGREQTLELQETGKKLEVDVPARFFGSKGVYKFNFLEGSDTIAPGNQSLILGSANETWENRLHQLAQNNSENNDCDDSTYLCFNEYFQSKSINSDLKAFRATGNANYLEKAVNYSLADWRETETSTCGDFNCTKYEDRETTAAMRQGTAITALWNVYSATGNFTVREKAVNYTEGAPDECDVNNGGFDCGNATNQAYMMQGFWTAYSVTNNSEYREKAINLTSVAENQNYSSPKIVSSLTTAYQTTGNNTYIDRVYEYYQKNSQNCENNCDNWTDLNNVKSGLEAYKVTGNNYFYRNSVNTVYDLDTDCLTNTSSNCQSPDQQADALTLTSLLYVSKKDQRERFVNPVLDQTPSRDQSLSIRPEMKGSVTNPVMNIYDSNDVLEDSCNLNNINNSCSIDFSTFEQGIYTVELQSANSTYPRQIPVAYSQRDISTEQKLLNLTRSSPENPENECNPWNNSFECVKDYETYQSFYIQGFTDVANSYRNETYKNILQNLSSPSYSFIDIDPNGKCLPEEDDYRCGTSASVDAGEIQGSLIKSLYSSYQATGKISTLDLAYNYSDHSTESGCKVWQDEFVCSSPEAQGLMIQGYWEAYEVTGNKSYRNVSLELANHSDFSSGTPELSAAFWETYTWTNNTKYREKAENITNNQIDTTDCPSCGTENLLDYGNMLVSAYRTSANNTYKNALETQQDNVSDICADGSCANPLLQGKAISFTSRTMNTLPVTIDVETSMNVSSSNLKIGEQARVTCSITNTMQKTNIGPIDIRILPGSRFNNTEMNTTASSLSYDETANYTGNVTASEAGDGIVECQFSSPDFTVEESSTITIEEVAEDNTTEDNPTNPTDSDSSGDSGFIPLPDPKPEENNTSKYNPRTENYNYTQQVLTPEEAGIPGDYRLKELHVETCFNASRAYYRNYTVLNASGCESEQLLLHDNTSAVEVFRNFTGSTSYNISVSENETDWKKPMIYRTVEKPLKIESGTSETVETRSEIQNVEFALNSRTECDLKRNGQVINEYNTSQVSAEVELVEGENKITLDCGETSKSMNVMYEKPLTEKVAENSPYILLGLLAAMAAVIGLKYHTLIEMYRSKMFNYRFNRFKSSLENEDVVEAVEQYNKMTKHENLDTVREKLMGSDVKMLTGLKMYLMSDMVTDPEIELTADEKSSIQNSINNYVNSHKNSKIAEKIRQNMDSQ